MALAFEEANLTRRKICIVADENTARLFAREVRDIVAGFSARVEIITFMPGESAKNLQTIQSFYERMIEIELDRRSVVVALGGGVTGDMAGFAAATFMRGLNFVQVPTSLLAQVDASVGGKTGVDFMERKNLIGAFYQPSFVYIALHTLSTLPREQFASGMGEVIKHGLILDSAYYEMLRRERDAIREMTAESLRAVAEGSCRIKADVVSRDEKESGLREVLNFGHTFGHALESFYNFTLPHGHCVALGMTAALSLSAARGDITAREFDDAKELLAFFKLPTEIAGFSPEDLFRRMKHDKKNKEDKINLILLRGIGSAYTEKEPTKDEIMSALQTITTQRERGSV